MAENMELMVDNSFPREGACERYCSAGRVLPVLTVINIFFTVQTGRVRGAAGKHDGVCTGNFPRVWKGRTVT